MTATITQNQHLHHAAMSLWKVWGFVSLTCVCILVMLLCEMSNVTWKNTMVPIQTVDIHRESPYRHLGMVHNHNSTISDKGSIKIAIGCALTFHRMGTIQRKNLIRIPFFEQMLISFCRTASPNYDYNFYVTYDYNDVFMGVKESNVVLFNKLFYKVWKDKCMTRLHPIKNVILHLVVCSHSGYPAWAQNDAMLEAYLDNMDYYYRINDDTIFHSEKWPNQFIYELSKYNPPKVGVVGPTTIGLHEKSTLLTYDFVHRTHIDIFGFYYPREFTDWYADNWISDVYLPNRSKKLTDVSLKHTLAKGQRYTYRGVGPEKLKYTLGWTQKVLNRYLEAKLTNKSVGFLEENDKKANVLAVAVTGKDADCMFGAIRNAQLIPLLLPGWKVRVYVADLKHNNAIPERIWQKLVSLGAAIKIVSGDVMNLNLTVWPFSIIDDMSVNAFQIRSCYHRLGTRDVQVINEWMNSQKGFHFIQDHPRHVQQVIVPDIWGGRPSAIKSFLNTSLYDILSNQITAKDSHLETIFNQIVWPLLEPISLCHDSVSCKEWKYTFPILTPRTDREYIGQKFTQYNTAFKDDVFPENVQNCSVLTNNTHLNYMYAKNVLN